MTTPAARILVVDDEFSVRDSLLNWFRKDGYQVRAVGNATEALRALQDEHVDVALLDIKMPGMDGMELQQRIREMDPLASIIFITAHASVDTAVQALKSGAFDYVTKPVDPDYLSHLVRNAVRHRALMQENLKLKERAWKAIKQAAESIEANYLSQMEDEREARSALEEGIGRDSDSGSDRAADRAD